MTLTDPEVVKALATVIADRTGYVWRPSGPAYSGAEVGITYGNLPDTPDAGIGLNLYDGQDDFSTELAERYVQIRFRGPAGARDGADEIASAVFTAIHKQRNVSGLSLITRVLVAPLSSDDAERQERADSYRIILE